MLTDYTVRLGMPTVWIKHGEGCDMIPNQQTGFPDFIVENILELPEAINRLVADQGCFNV